MNFKLFSVSNWIELANGEIHDYGPTIVSMQLFKFARPSTEKQDYKQLDNRILDFTIILNMRESIELSICT